jgi:hypothetical protein
LNVIKNHQLARGRNEIMGSRNPTIYYHSSILL